MDDRQAYQIKIALFRSDPLVWRTLAVPRDATLDELHECIQILFGWNDIHDYYFEQVQSQKKYVRFPKEWDSEDQASFASSFDTSLQECLSVGDQWKYVYDMENNQCHDLWIVKEVTLKNAGEPQLVEWKEDNLINNEPQFFDAHAIQHSLAMLRFQQVAVPPIVMMADCCESLFMLTNEESLIHIEHGDESYYVFFINRENEDRNIQIFRSKEDFVESYFSTCEHTSIHALYQNGYVMHFPGEFDYEMSELPLEMMEPQLVRYDRGKGETEISKEEFNELFALFKFLAFMEPYWEDNLGYLPDLQEGLMMYVARSGNQVHSELRYYEPVLKKSRIQLGKKAMSALACAKRSQERLNMNLLAVPDLINEDYEYTFYIAASGMKTGFLHRLHSRKKHEVMKEVRDHVVTYMAEYGIPKTIDVDDRHLYMMLTQICKDLKVKIYWGPAVQEVLSEQFEEAIREQNPLSDMDQDLLEALAQMSEDELVEYVEQQPDEKMKKLLKQLVYLNLFHK